MDGDRKSSTVGTYVMAAVFLGFGLIVPFLDGADGGRRTLPNWLAGVVLVLVGIGLIVVARRRRQ